MSELITEIIDYVTELIQENQIHKKAEALLSYIEKLMSDNEEFEDQLELLKSDINQILYDVQISIEELEIQNFEST